MDERAYDQRKARNDPQMSRTAPPNASQIPRLPKYGAVYFVTKGNDIQQVILPIEGVGMWGTLYGFIAIDRDGNTVRGLTLNCRATASTVSISSISSSPIRGGPVRFVASVCSVLYVIRVANVNEKRTVIQLSMLEASKTTIFL
jgi:hypothetical protein